MNVFAYIRRQMVPLVVILCFACLASQPAKAQLNQSFEGSGLPAGWTFSGPAGLFGTASASSGIGPTDGTFYGWISTGCTFAAGTTCPTVATMTTPSYATLGLGTGMGLGSPTLETVLTSPSFTLAAATQISFDVNFITTDGTTSFADFAVVQLVAIDPINLFVANTTNATSPAVPPTDLNAGVATISPATALFAGTTVTLAIDANPADNTLFGNVAKFGGGNGGPTGWMHVTYTAAAGTYTLRFLVSHVGDNQYPSALAIDNVKTSQVQTTPANNLNTTTTDTTVRTDFSTAAGHNVSDVIVPPGSDLTFPGSDAPTLQFQTANIAISDPTNLTHDTPFATIVPFEVASNDPGTTGNGAKYEVRCTDINHPTPSEGICPFASIPGTHVRHKVIFDSTGTPPAIIPGTMVADIHWPPGPKPPCPSGIPCQTTSATSWSPSPKNGPGSNPDCPSVTYPGFACDLENAIVNKYGGTDPTNPTKYSPNGFKSDTGKGDYLLGYNVPMPCSTWFVNGMQVNTACIQGNSTFFFSTPLKFHFVASPAKCPATMATVCSGNGWIAAPVAELFSTLDPVGTAPDLPGKLILLADTNPPNCPGPLPNTNCPVPNGISCPGTNCMVAANSPAQPGASSTANVEFTTTLPVTTEGQYELQVSTGDTVGNHELNFSLLNAGACPDPFSANPDPNKPAGGWIPPCYSTKMLNAQIVVDNTPPTITITTPSNGAAYVLTQPVAASYGCADALSGVASCAGPVANGINIDTASVGSKTFTVNSTDKAIPPNASSATVNYTVVSYNAFVQQPINADNSSVFSAKRGVVPVKFTLSLNGVATCALPPAMIALTRTAGGVVGSIDESTYLLASDNGPNFRIDSCQYVYNLAVSSLGPGTYRVDIAINGVVVGNGVFGLQ